MRSTTTIDSLPVTLTGIHDHDAEPSSFVLERDFDRGTYQLNILLEEPEHNQLLVVFLDDKPIDTLGVPFWGDSDDNWPESRRDRATGERLEFSQQVKTRYGLPELYEERRRNRQNWTLTSAFAINTSGRHKLSVQNMNGDRCGPVFYMGDGVKILDATIDRKPLDAPDTFKRRFPGLPMLDAWGWMVYLDFDNPSGREEPAETIILEAIQRAKKWGANMLEMNPTVSDGHFFDFESDGGAVPGTTKSSRTNWTTARLRELFTEAHRHGMLLELFIFSLGGFSMLRQLDSEQVLYFYKRLNQLLGCGDSSAETMAAIDGVIYEIFPHDAPRQTDEAWQVNPGLAQTVSGGVTGTAMELKNNGYSAAFANYTAHWVGMPAQQTGYDCLFPAVPYPQAFCQRQGEIGVSYLQGCAESRRLFETRMLRTNHVKTGVPGRTAAPDWIFAQLQGFAQRRWRDELDTVASVLCWEAMSEEICPESTKRALYAATQDPIRACLTGDLTDTGRGGMIDIKRLVKRAPTETLTRLLPRHEYPSTCRFLRNQELEVLHFPDRDYNVMQLDLTRSARFYGNGCLAQVFAPLFCNGVEADSTTAFDESYTVVEHGGATAAVEQDLDISANDGHYRETRRMRMLSDVPGIRIDVRRNAASGATAQSPVVNVMGFSEAYSLQLRDATDQTVVVGLTDPEDVLPPLLIKIAATNTAITEVKTEGALVFSTALETVHALDVTVLFATGHLTDCDTAALAKLADSLFDIPTLDVAAPGDVVTVPNNLNLEHAATVGLTGQLRGPIRVRENGWWYFRGISESNEFPGRHFAKINLHSADSTALVEARFPVDGELGWGWGSQYQLLLSDVEHDGEECIARITVCNTTPFIFAPRVRLRDEPDEITLNGEPWNYADGRDVFLPNRVGEYELRWRYGRTNTPKLCRTFATVNTCRADGDTLVLELEKPPHVTKDFGHHGYYALIEHNGERTVHRIHLGNQKIGMMP